LEEEKSLGRKYKSFFIEKTTQKCILERSAPLPTIKECWCSLSLFGGVLERPFHPYGGVLPYFEKILGLLRKLREESLKS
jgi:hypothetical protein